MLVVSLMDELLTRLVAADGKRMPANSAAARVRLRTDVDYALVTDVAAAIAAVIRAPREGTVQRLNDWGGGNACDQHRVTTPNERRCRVDRNARRTDAVHAPHRPMRTPTVDGQSRTDLVENNRVLHG